MFKEFLEIFVVLAVILAVVLATIGFRVWQCEELFPEADIVACVLWK